MGIKVKKDSFRTCLDLAVCVHLRRQMGYEPFEKWKNDPDSTRSIGEFLDICMSELEKAGLVDG